MAGKFGTLMLTMGGSLVVFHLLGLLPSGFTSYFLSLFLNPENLQTSDLVIRISAIISGVVLVFASLRLLGFESDMAMLGSMILILMGFAWDFLIIFQTVASFSLPFAILVVSPLCLMYVIAVVEWWRGVTT